MTREIHGIARSKIHPGKLAEWKRVAAQCMESARTKDSGTLQYDWFLSSDQTECICLERFRDSDALLEHVANLGELMGAMQEVCSVSGEILGTPSPKLREALEGYGLPMYAAYQVLTP
jgi:quinol monooxygenase YgiN